MPNVSADNSQGHIRSPKQVGSSGGHVEERWYPYYAGYTEGFVDDVISTLDITAGSTILDPWNGSGTTTVRAAAAGCRAIGLDANPVLVLVGRGRLLQRGATKSITPLAEEILDVASRKDQPLDNDPLQVWLKEGSVGPVRSLEQATYQVLIDRSDYELLATKGLDGVSTIASVFYVALFATLRSQLRKLKGSNPTWTRTPKTEEERVEIDALALRRDFLSACTRLQNHLAGCGVTDQAGEAGEVKLGDSISVDLSDCLADVVITSPPYCTRIDYVVSTAAELALLGFGKTELKVMRDAMVGTPTISGEDSDSQLTPSVLALLDSIRTHESKASESYYHKYYRQYFSSMTKSLSSITNSCTSDARMVLVVQDSYYKEVRVDLASLLPELADQYGWRLRSKTPFAVISSKAAVNPGARKYRSEFGAEETVLFLTREAQGTGVLS